MKSPDDVADQAQVSTPEVAKAEAPSKAEHSLEVEIKLGGEPEALDQAWHAIIAARGSFSTKQLESTYFDTPDLRLRRRGFTLHCPSCGGMGWLDLHGDSYFEFLGATR